MAKEAKLDRKEFSVEVTVNEVDREEDNSNSSEKTEEESKDEADFLFKIYYD